MGEQMYTSQQSPRDGLPLGLSSTGPNGMPEDWGAYWSDPGKFTLGGTENYGKWYNEETQLTLSQLTFRALRNTIEDRLT